MTSRRVPFRNRTPVVQAAASHSYWLNYPASRGGGDDDDDDDDDTNEIKIVKTINNDTKMEYDLEKYAEVSL